MTEALQTVTNAIKSDKDLAWGWQCNIAMCAVDEGVEHKTANRAAARFMRLLFGVDVTNFKEYHCIMNA